MPLSGPSMGEAELGGEEEGDRPRAVSTGSAETWGQLFPQPLFQHGDVRSMRSLNST